ncbi:MAG: flagellar hook-associated protein FlgK [Lysobacter sp.]
MSGLLSTGSSALLAFQRALNTVGHNVANASTPGYSRQRVHMEARVGQDNGAGAIGTGVDAVALQRLADGLVFGRQIDSSSEMGRLQQLSSLSTRLDTLVSDSTSGLAGPWSNFFAAAEGVTAEPTSTAARNQLLASGTELATRWAAIDSRMGQLDSEVNDRIQAQVATANRLASEIATLNGNIAAAGSNASPDMLDQRALRVDALAALVGAETVTQDDGSLNVFTTGGQALVLGNRAMALGTTPDPYRADRLQISLQGADGKQTPLPSSTVSGEVGGLIEFRERVLDPARAELGRLATAFAEGFNATQRAGVDYNGKPGADMFALPAPRVDRHAGNTGGANLTASVGDLGALTGHDLVLRFDGGNWSATRPGSGESVAIAGTGTAADPLRVDGVELVIDGTPASGDRFSLRPTAGVAGGLKMVLDDPYSVAAAAPLEGAPAAGNVGSGTLGGSRITDPAAFAGFGGGNIEFIDDGQYSIDGGPPVAWQAGEPIRGNGWELDLTGTPAAGDSFSVNATPPRSSDNGNARQLAGLDELDVLAGGTLDLTAAMGQFTGKVGGEARHADLALEAQGAINNQVIAERESLSGVNLDEEATNLLRYQQAYMAAAQVIATADTMFQSLLGAVRR